MFNLSFFINSFLFGIALAMDAFSVSIVNGIKEPGMKMNKACTISGTFAAFQFAMPLAGWYLVRTLVDFFTGLTKIVPWIGVALLLFIGGKMIIESIAAKKKGEEKEAEELGKGGLIIQGIATSIDALSVGFTISDYSFSPALVECLIIAVTTFGICFAGCHIGKKAGEKLSDKAEIVGGIILLGIAVEIAVKTLRG